MIKKYIISTIIIMVILILINPVNVNQNSPIKIGIILPLTGDLALIGEPAKLGAEMALKKFKNKKNTYQLIFEDDQYNVAKTVTAANKLISTDKIIALITLGSAEGNGVKPIANKNKIIHFNTATSDQTIADGIYIFNHWTPPIEESKVMVTKFIKEKIKKVAIFTTNNDGMMAIASELKRQLKENEIEIILDEIISVGERDFRTQIAKLKNNLPDIIVLQNTPPELEILAKQIKEVGIKIPMTSIEVFDTTSAPDLFKGFWYVTAGDFTDKFKDEYSLKDNRIPALATGNIYDMVTLIITAAERTTGKLTAEKISTELLKVQGQDGAMGSLSINNHGAVISGASLKTVK